MLVIFKFEMNVAAKCVDFFILGCYVFQQQVCVHTEQVGSISVLCVWF